MRFQREIAGPNLFDELLPLLVKHYHEIAHYNDIKLEPDWEAYENTEKSGGLRVFTARAEVTTGLLGYAVFFVWQNIHYKSSKQATQDILFIDPDHRGSGFGAKFISYCDEELRKESVQVVYHHVKDKHNFGALLERMTYKLVDLIYARRLD